MPEPLPPLYSLPEVAAALGQTERYVQEKTRLREWPHRRLARGVVAFTAEDYAKVLELCASAPVEMPAPRLAFAPRSRRLAS